MSRARLERRLEALEVQQGRPVETSWPDVLRELSDHALDQVIKIHEDVAAANGWTADQELILTTDQEIEVQVILTMDAPDPETLARWKSWAGFTSPDTEEIDQAIDDQVRKLIADRAAREVTQ